MEVIVDDTQLSLAIGKKGQNVRLAAKLLGWRVDIKSEEEKRQEVESQMAALVVPGAPVSVLLDHGLAEGVVDKLAEAGILTVEKLGTMTPEQLEEIPGVEPGMVENIQAIGGRPITASSKNRPLRPRLAAAPAGSTAQRKNNQRKYSQRIYSQCGSRGQPTGTEKESEASVNGDVAVEKLARLETSAPGEAVQRKNQ